MSRPDKAKTQAGESQAAINPLEPPADNIFPALKTFEAIYGAGKPQVAWTRLVADLETPVSAYLKIASGQAMSFLLESVEGGATRGR